MHDERLGFTPAQLARRYGVNTCAIWRAWHTGDNGFPAPDMGPEWQYETILAWEATKRPRKRGMPLPTREGAQNG